VGRKIEKEGINSRISSSSPSEDNPVESESTTSSVYLGLFVATLRRVLTREDIVCESEVRRREREGKRES